MEPKPCLLGNGAHLSKRSQEISAHQANCMLWAGPPPPGVTLVPRSAPTHDNLQIAKLLGSINKSEDPDAPSVDVFLQDPSYQPKDHKLLDSENVQILEDPHGLLAIDENTLVIAPFLPTSVPVMQIIADMFPLGSGPAALIVDKMDLNPERGYFNHMCRTSPEVIRMMRSYEAAKGDFSGELLGEELKKDLGDARLRY